MNPTPTLSFSVDFEDWYQGIELPFADWSKYEPRIEKGLMPVLDLLSERGQKGTFFTLGWIAEKYPQLVKEIASRGHELASHGYSHEKVYDLTPDQFRTEVSRTKKVIEDLTGKPCVAYRAPFFSITAKSLWALPILAEEGYTIDCSISPVKTWRYGIASCPDEVFFIPEIGIIEFPVSSFRAARRNWSVGGAYFRLLPYFLTRRGIRNRLAENKATMFYIHPWEYDPAHPKVEMERKAKFTHYTRLKKTIPFTRQLLNDFSFTTVSEAVKNITAHHSLPHVSTAVLQNG
jgi:polysaccharide deacetylase family protein (PEP-CTERM system associated)